MPSSSFARQVVTLEDQLGNTVRAPNLNTRAPNLENSRAESKWTGVFRSRACRRGDTECCLNFNVRTTPFLTNKRAGATVHRPYEFVWEIQRV